MTKTKHSVRVLVLLGLACSAPGWAVEQEAQSPGVVEKVERAIARGAHAAASGVERGAKATARGLDRAASATAHGVRVAASGVKRGADATVRGVEKAADKVTGSGTPASSPAK